MRATQIYRQALQELASEGSEKAKFALSLGESTDDTSNEVRPGICSVLKNANLHLQNALAQNASRWSSETDRHVAAAQQNILDAIAIMAKS